MRESLPQKSIPERRGALPTPPPPLPRRERAGLRVTAPVPSALSVRRGVPCGHPGWGCGDRAATRACPYDEAQRRSRGEEGQDRGVGDGFRPAPERRTGAGDGFRPAPERRTGAGDGFRPAPERRTGAGDGFRPAPEGRTGAGDGFRPAPERRTKAPRGVCPSRRLVFQWVPACAGTTVYVPSGAAGGSGRRGPLCRSSSRRRLGRPSGPSPPCRCSTRLPALPVCSRSACCRSAATLSGCSGCPTRRVRRHSACSC